MKNAANERTDATDFASQLPLNLNTGTSSERTLWSVGHSDRSIGELLEKLQVHQIDRVVDVRTKPYSRRCPQFNREDLELSLAEADINYDFRGNNLGGLGENIRYAETLEELCILAESERIALLCSEGAPAKCHRKRVLQPDLQKMGVTVVHITY